VDNNSKNSPIYFNSAEIAIKNNELDLYRESKQKNIDCANAIDKAVKENYKGDFLYDLKTAVKSVIDEFGFDRINFVLASDLKNRDYDGRFSDENKKWARTFYFPQNEENTHFAINTHPAILDGFIDRLREIFDEQESKKIISKHSRSKSQNYKIKKAVLFTNNSGFILAEKPPEKNSGIKSPIFAVWKFVNKNGTKNYSSGHYFDRKYNADCDFNQRAADYKFYNNVVEMPKKLSITDKIKEAKQEISEEKTKSKKKNEQEI
jgi:hypothetical protein